MGYHVILCDPNWSYNSRSPWKKTRFGGGVAGHYETMSEADLCELGTGVKAITAERAVCCMWTTGTHMESAFKVMRAWGFRPVKPIFVWVKTTPKGKIFPGPGYYTSSNAEYVLLGTKGRPWHANRRNVGGDGVAVPETVLAPHPKDASKKKIHSAKPAIFHRHIEHLFGDFIPHEDPAQRVAIRRLEIFARVRVPGWDAVGDQLAERPCRLTPSGIVYLDAPAGGVILPASAPVEVDAPEERARVVQLRLAV